jgi:hypothetical protein
MAKRTYKNVTGVKKTLALPRGQYKEIGTGNVILDEKIGDGFVGVLVRVDDKIVKEKNKKEKSKPAPVKEEKVEEVKDEREVVDNKEADEKSDSVVEKVVKKVKKTVKPKAKKKDKKKK